MKQRNAYLVILLLFVAIPLQAFAFDFVAISPSGHSIRYSIISTKKKTVSVDLTNYKNSVLTGSIIIPDIVEHEGVRYSVIRIDAGAFKQNNFATTTSFERSIDEITLPLSVMEIGNNAFSNVYNVNYHGTALGETWGAITLNGCIKDNVLYKDSSMAIIIAGLPNAKDVIISNNVIEIAVGAFKYCKNLRSVSIPESIKEIPDEAFMYSSLRAIELPDVLSVIGKQAFAFCNIKYLHIPSKVKSIGVSAFSRIDTIEYFGSANENYPPWGAKVFIGNHSNTPTGISEETVREFTIREVKGDFMSGTKRFMHSHYVSSIDGESHLKDYLQNKLADNLEGIYTDGYSLFGLLKDSTEWKYYLIFLGCNGNSYGWKRGDIKAILDYPNKQSVCDTRWYNNDFFPSITKTQINRNSISLLVDNDVLVLNKTYPDVENETAIIPNEKWSGTGWAIGNGYLVTNNHVVDGASTITVKGVGGNANVGYSAEVVATDKINDIAILRINDSRFTGFGNIPYSVSPRIADVGEDVLVLGYPLGQLLGDEIKLTTGIINSRTGAGEYQNCYQIQAPITNGNSGGPVFDSKCNVIGIVVAGLNKELNLAENVGYAIKTSYLKILIESAGLNITFPSNNTISTLSRPEKVKRVKNFVYYIECSK